MWFPFWRKRIDEFPTAEVPHTESWIANIKVNVGRILDELGYMSRDLTADLTIIKNNIDDVSGKLSTLKDEIKDEIPKRDDNIYTELVAAKLEISRLNTLLESNMRFIQDTLTKYVERSVAAPIVQQVPSTPTPIPNTNPYPGMLMGAVYTEEQIRAMPFTERKKLLGIGLNSNGNGAASRLP